MKKGHVLMVEKRKSPTFNNRELILAQTQGRTHMEYDRKTGKYTEVID